MTPKLHDSSVALIDTLDHSELTLVRESISRKSYDLETSQEYLERMESLQPKIEDIASKLKIACEDLPDRWEQLVRLVVHGDCSALYGKPSQQFKFPTDTKPSCISEELLEIVTINVGEAEHRKTYKIHKKFAIDRSPVFNAGFSGNFIQAETLSVDLVDVEHEVFDIFVQWLYTSEIHKQGSKLPRRSAYQAMGSCEQAYGSETSKYGYLRHRTQSDERRPGSSYRSS